MITLPTTQSRFVNCTWGTDQRTNLAAKQIYDKDKRPHVLLYATRAIAKGDEFFCDYGLPYWRTVALELQSLHFQ